MMHAAWTGQRTAIEHRVSLWVLSMCLHVEHEYEQAGGDTLSVTSVAESRVAFMEPDDWATV